MRGYTRVWARPAAALWILLLLALFGLAPAHGVDNAVEGIPTIPVAQLPYQAREALQLIHAGGPFPYAKDGVVFGNYERLLPRKPRGYYREYTVRTPGARDRGARRIISGQGRELYYTDDHYRSFKRIIE